MDVLGTAFWELSVPPADQKIELGPDVANCIARDGLRVAQPDAVLVFVVEKRVQAITR
jgi:hypothetical protein